jgi:hypothetical protein
MSGKINPKIILEDKEYELEKIHISELNYLMVRLFNPIEKNYTTYNLGDYNPENNFIKDEIEKRYKGLKPLE